MRNTSKKILELAMEMDRDNGGSLSQEYVFFDGTFRRYPTCTAFAAHVYVEVINMMVKLFTIETENEGKECVCLC